MERHKNARIFQDEDLTTRMAWVDAGVACRQVVKGKAIGNRVSLQLRACLQSLLFRLGCTIQKSPWNVLLVGIILLCVPAIMLYTTSYETRMEKLWVEEGGRLEQELAYTRQMQGGEESGVTSEMLLQAAARPGDNVLTVASLQLHLRALIRATKLYVDMFNTRWKLKDLCHSLTLPVFESHELFDSIITNLMPCQIITPLDCFWEGSKILGPEFGVPAPTGYMSGPVRWSNLNPLQLVQNLTRDQYIPTSSMVDLLNRAGVSSGYQHKPCLNPRDPECPATAPNKGSLQMPNVASIVTGGCHGFATKLMHWPEDLLLGDVTKNSSGHIVRASAMQSLVQLMGEQEVFEFWRDTEKVRRLSSQWTVDKAVAVLRAWKGNFTQAMLDIMPEKNSPVTDKLYALSSVSLQALVQDFCRVSWLLVLLSGVILALYACLALMVWRDCVHSQSAMGVCGVLLVCLATVSALGACVSLGIRFNAATTQVLPFLSVGLGVNNVFLLAYAMADIVARRNIPAHEKVGECLKRNGLSIILSSLCVAAAFFLATLVPIPALRTFCIQVGTVVVFNLLAVLLIFPAVLACDVRRLNARRIDVFCCIKSTETDTSPCHHQLASVPIPPTYSELVAAEARATSPPMYSEVVAPRSALSQVTQDGCSVNTVLPDLPWQHRSRSLSDSGTLGHRQRLLPTGQCDRCQQRRRLSTLLATFAHRVFAPFLTKLPIKICVLIVFFATLAVSGMGLYRLKEGLDLTDVVPQGTDEHSFLEQQERYFGFYNFYVVTKDVDYPARQELLDEYHAAFEAVPRIIRTQGNELPISWLQAFRDWLLDIQQAYDLDLKRGLITRDGYAANATDKSALAFVLMLQTGDVDVPVDRERIHHGRLVDSEGTINPSAFYHYLTAWVSTDALAYAATQADLRPLPHSDWVFDRHSECRPPRNMHQVVPECEIPRSAALQFAQMSFYLRNMSHTDAMKETIVMVRDICDQFTARGLPTYPSGIPFTYWEQYVRLRFYVLLASACVVTATFVILALGFLTFLLPLIVVFLLCAQVVQVLGAMGLLGIHLSAITGVMVTVSLGLTIDFMTHIGVDFMTCNGDRNKRVRLAVRLRFAPVIHAAVSTLIGVVMLVNSPYDFIEKYFFCVLLLSLGVGLFNGLFVLPVLLSLLGPSSDVRPVTGETVLPCPTPQSSPPRTVRPLPQPAVTYFPSHFRVPTDHSDQSLSTISEEPSRFSSASELSHNRLSAECDVMVETHLANSNQADDLLVQKQPSSSHTVTVPAGRRVTSFTTTATVKVDIQTAPDDGITVAGDGSQEQRKRKSNKMKSSALSAAT